MFIKYEMNEWMNEWLMDYFLDIIIFILFFYILSRRKEREWNYDLVMIEDYIEKDYVYYRLKL